MIRKATPDDLEIFMTIYEAAKAFMRQNGNLTQWVGGYPPRSLVLSDINDGNMYAVCDGDGRICGCFGMFSGDDPTYRVIDGEWASHTPYAAIHRVASDGTLRGVFRQIFLFASQKHPHLRIDTHADNIPMQRAVSSCGFVYRGIIHLADGSPRLAYDYTV